MQALRVQMEARVVQGLRERHLARARRLGLSEELANHSCRHFDHLLGRMEAGEFDPHRPPEEEPRFCLRGLPRPLLVRIQRIQGTGRAADFDRGIELLVKFGCRGHRNFVDRQGMALPFRFAPADGTYTRMSHETFELYEGNNLVGTLAVAIWILQAG
jgi:hypothetical protein